MRSLKFLSSSEKVIVLILLFLFAGCTPFSAQRSEAVTSVPEEKLNQAAETAPDSAGESNASEATEVAEATETLSEIVVNEVTAVASSRNETDNEEGAPGPDLGDDKPAAKNPAEITIEDGVVLVYKRSGGLVGLEEAFTIYEDGRLTSNNEQEWQADAEEVEELLAEIGELGFFEMDGTYIPKDQCCDRFSYELSVLDGEEVFTVRTIDAAPGAPNELWFVLDKVQQLINGQTR